MSQFTAADFWTQQPFARLETYSFNRGPTSAALRVSLELEIEQASAALARARYLQRAKLENRLQRLQNALRGNEYHLKLFDPASEAAYTTQKIAAFNQGSAAARQLGALCQQAGAQEVYAGCPPVYRDALVFCDAQGQVVQVLNICFGCLFMATADNVPVAADLAIYAALHQLLIGLGHPLKALGW